MALIIPPKANAAALSQAGVGSVVVTLPYRASCLWRSSQVHESYITRLLTHGTQRNRDLLKVVQRSYQQTNHRQNEYDDRSQRGLRPVNTET